MSVRKESPRQGSTAAFTFRIGVMNAGGEGWLRRRLACDSSRCIAVPMSSRMSLLRAGAFYAGRLPGFSGGYFC